MAEVAPSEWKETGAIVVSLTADGADVETVSVDEFDRRVDDAAVQLPSGG